MSAPNPLQSPTNPAVYKSLPSQALDCATPTTPDSKHTTLPLAPTARETTVRHKQEDDADRFDGHNHEEYQEYTLEDLGQQVFIDFEVFLKRALHVPENWREEWGPVIETVKASEEFNTLHKEYCDLCDKVGGHEADFYKPLTQLVNSIFDIAISSCPEGKTLQKRQYYHVDNPMMGLSPDLVLLDKDQVPLYSKAPRHWTSALHVLEVKPYDDMIFEGRGIPRLIVNGVDPLTNHPGPLGGKRFRNPLIPATASTQAGSRSTVKLASKRQPTSKKRRAGGSSTEDTPGRKRSKMEMLPPPSVSLKSTSHQTAKSSAMAQAGSTSHQTLENCPSVQAKTEGGDHPPTKQAQESDAGLERHTGSALQVSRCLLEMFSSPPLRLHVTASLVDRHRIQFYRASRSAILISSAINFTKEESEGKDKFIASVLAFHHLSLEQNGIIGNRVLGLDNTKGNELGGGSVVQEGNVLHFSKGAEGKELNVILEGVVALEPEMVGRSTVVLNASVQGGDSKKPPLVVKISWPTSNRVSEIAFLKTACSAATGEHAWAANHLPKVYRAREVTQSPGSTLESVASLFDDAEFAGGRSFVYKRRVLRIFVQERLVPLKCLPTVKEIGQVFFDIASVHRWLYLFPGILHRDLSPSNIMCRYKIEEGERKVYGVLMDFDLSSWKEALKGDNTMASQQWAGTPPYMALELLVEKSCTHLYRHDLESLFYVMLLTATRRSIGIPEGETERRLVRREVSSSQKLPFHDWLDHCGCQLGGLKLSFLHSLSIDLSPDFQDFQEWLEYLQRCFRMGFASRPLEQDLEWSAQSAPRPAPGAFDEETLGGWITYGAFIKFAPYLTGKLKGLIVRYHESCSGHPPDS